MGDVHFKELDLDTYSQTVKPLLEALKAGDQNCSDTRHLGETIARCFIPPDKLPIIHQYGYRGEGRESHRWDQVSFPDRVDPRVFRLLQELSPELKRRITGLNLNLEDNLTPALLKLRGQTSIH